jgi:hypothetical protein
MEKDEQLIFLAEKYAEAWRKLDAEIIFPFLADDFTYGSMWVFQELDLEGYKTYLRGKFDAIRKTDSAPDVKTGYSENGDVCVGLNQGGRNAYIHLKEENGKLKSAYMMAF